MASLGAMIMFSCEYNLVFKSVSGGFGCPPGGNGILMDLVMPIHNDTDGLP